LLGLSCYGAQHFALAIRYLKPAAAANPDNSELHQALAQSCLWAKQYSCALEEFRQILQRNPDSAAAHMLSGEALDGLEKTDEAIKEFQAAVQAAPREPNAHFGLGYLYWKVREYDKARSEFEAELAIDPNHAQAMAYLGDIEARQEHWEAALGWLQKSIQSRNDIRMAALDLGVVLAQLRRYAELAAALKQAIAMDPAQPDAHYRLGRVYQQMGRQAESQQEFARVRELRQRADEDMVRKLASRPPVPGSQESKRRD
jgi:tetratricopeptide (TPR) repeat protein